jgi:hypothetical protein
MGKTSRSGSVIRIRDEHTASYFIELNQLRYNFWIKIIKFFDADADPDTGIFMALDLDSGMEKVRIRDPG